MKDISLFKSINNILFNIIKDSNEALNFFILIIRHLDEKLKYTIYL